MPDTLRPGLERRLKSAIQGEVRFDRFTRGRYATDASHYQMMPIGVVTPRTMDDAARAIDIAREESVTVLARGGGTSQCGQTVNESLVIDCSKYLNRIIDIDVANRRCVVEPGIVLEDLNRALKPHGLWFPVDISTASRATIGGMTGNNSCGARSLRYGNTRENVVSIEAILAGGRRQTFGSSPADLSDHLHSSAMVDLGRDLLALGAREADEIVARFPKVQRRVGGYNLDALLPGRNDLNLAHILVGSEGTLGFTTQVELKLAPLLGRRAVGACHFGRFHDAMDAAQHIVRLKPIGVELVDRTMIELAREIAIFRPTLEQFVRGTPDAILLVEFGEDDQDENLRRLRQLSELMGDLGYSFAKTGAKQGGVVEVLDPALQAAITDVRTSGLNIMMSMKDEGKPVSFVEDCAVPLEHLAEYTARLTEVFEKNGTRGTWYAHASVGCLHVRPILNLRLDKDVKAMRAIAEEAFAMVRAYKGSHSGEHGDGLVRSEFHEFMFGSRLVHAFEEVKTLFDPGNLFNPGKIVRAPKFDDRNYFRFRPGYRGEDITTRLDWSAWPGKGGGFQGAVEMCNNNGACRKIEGGVMCPSYRVTRDEKDVTRGRANSLRLAVTGQLGANALTSDDMAETMKLCVSCKACRRECPTGVDMARMKIEVLSARAARFGFSLRDRLIGWLPRYAPHAAKVPWLLNLRNVVPGAGWLSEVLAGFSAKRSLPRWRTDIFCDPSPSWPGLTRPSTTLTKENVDARHEAGHDKKDMAEGDIVLFADTFNRYFERENLDDAIAVLSAAGYRVHIAQPLKKNQRPLCCGRTFLSVGAVDQAREEAERTLAALKPFIDKGVPVIGLEPSCILSFRDEIPALIKSDTSKALSQLALTFEEFLAREHKAGRFSLKLKSMPQRALVHGHCHQKAFEAFTPVQTVLKLIPDLKVEAIESSCCGMAGAFGYAADSIDVSLAMGELSLLPAVRKAPDDAILVADGTSCRHQIHDGAGRDAMHVARVLARAIA
ncbi:FAD-binding and (Fe-S)-binding domain-containing protein [Pseudorhodoplanes sinuspersici]|uniref:FAD-binding oxidoreductase n=1 Tax=Pseudorhodoplanes sinuspersici TaxID=1235591 RepID=A0A1W6ZRE2_9HYPH|nr:FAD-binding and (Fe-S)-binding domain-containing protein [Pseudorhodoplanes sinuspersici]ARP99334.1 FAD-binding oxidoreductase [Pseudorhodoplanes sinuspersici]RKE70263.1 FAD/FMN-containing dehydrogenase [Pseudorhodoplanes sinuspersici]